MAAAAHTHTIKTYGPDRCSGFSPIPAMSMVSHAVGNRYIQLIGGVMTSFYDWYADLPVASPQVFLVDTHGELPDYLPMVLEFAACVDLDAGRELLIEYRPSLEMLRLGLLDDKLPHSLILRAICDALPGKSPADQQAVMKMAGYGPPTESVGLEPYDPRLLPLARS